MLHVLCFIARLCARVVSALLSALLSVLPAHAGQTDFIRAESIRAVPSATPSPPASLTVPALGVRDAPVVTLPLVDGGWDESQLGAREVGLLQSAGRWPGDELAMALAGHVTLEGEQRGPFYGLGSLRPGAQIILRVGDGRDWRYHVTGQSLLQPGDVKRIFRRDGRALLLLTCAVWDDAQHTYRYRLLIEARLDPLDSNRADQIGADGTAPPPPPGAYSPPHTPQPSPGRIYRLE